MNATKGGRRKKGVQGGGGEGEGEGGVCVCVDGGGESHTLNAGEAKYMAAAEACKLLHRVLANRTVAAGSRGMSGRTTRRRFALTFTLCQDVIYTAGT
jgi:hypothetical protein